MNPAVVKSRRTGALWRRGGQPSLDLALVSGPEEGTSVCFLDEDLWEEPEDPVRTLRRFLGGSGFLLQISRSLLKWFLKVKAQFQKPPYLTEDHPDWRICEYGKTHGLQGPEGRVHLPLCDPILEGSWNRRRWLRSSTDFKIFAFSQPELLPV